LYLICILNHVKSSQYVKHNYSSDVYFNNGPVDIRTETTTKWKSASRKPNTKNTIEKSASTYTTDLLEKYDQEIVSSTIDYLFKKKFQQ
jgi:hypothetical protein